jgi:hypothetical protein
LELGLGGHTRALTPWMVLGVSTWDGVVVQLRRLSESSVVMAGKALDAYSWPISARRQGGKAATVPRETSFPGLTR